AHRRLKNIAMVLEWLPDAPATETVSAAELGIMFDSPERRLKLNLGRRLKLKRAFELFDATQKGRAFELFDATQKGYLDPKEFRRLATLIDPTLTAAAAEQLRKRTSSDPAKDKLRKRTSCGPAKDKVKL
ncbi:hypothetical protein T484DRAFT_1846158, partial [Baffinella frigidus]